MFRPATILTLAFVVAQPLIVGCGSGQQTPTPLPDYGSEDGVQIALLVSEFNDAKTQLVKAKKLFAGSPPNVREYQNLAFEVVVGSPKVDGTTATASVKVLSDADMKPIATTEWTFTKVGDAWKIKSAPLP